MTKYLGLAEARAAIIECEACPRLRSYCAGVAREKRRAYRDDTYWGKPVPGFGDPRARLLLVGLAPAAHGANRTGRLHRRRHRRLRRFLIAALHAGFSNISTSRDPDDGLVLHDAFITAAVRCAPPGNKPTPEEISRCLPHLDAEIDRATARPRRRRARQDCLLTLSAATPETPRRHAPPATGIRPRGRLPLPDGGFLIGCYHPSRQNTNTESSRRE